MNLIKIVSKYLDSKKDELKKQGVRLVVSGSKEGINEKLLKKIKWCV